MSSTTPLNTGRSSELSKVEKYTISFSNSLALRVYSDTKPHNMLIADLQKGLILIYKGAETVGEGTGFGVPVLLYSDETYFSGSSHVYLSRQNDLKIIRKEFFMDKVSRKRIRKVKLENKKLRAVSRYMAELYQKYKYLRPVMSTGIPERVGVHDSFVKSILVGKVVVTYGISQGRIMVKTDFSLLKKENLQKIFMLNEQGSSFFRRYSDSNGANLIDKQIGAWETIEAEWASITDLLGRVGFRLWKTKNTVLRRGRELLKGCIDWVGLDYEIDPKNDVFEYEIEILEG